MPSEYVIFFEEFKKYQQNEERTLWIMKPVYIHLIYRLQNVKVEEYLFSTKLVIFRNGKAQQKTHMSKIMCARDIYSILYFSEVVSLI